MRLMSENPVPFVSLVVPVRNERGFIDACLDNVLAQDHPADKLEVLVVDGGSDDGTRERLAERAASDPRIVVLDNPAGSTASGLNRGIEAARGDIVGVVSGHSALQRDYVSRSVASLAETGAWAVGGRIERMAHTGIQRAIAAATASPIGVGDARHNFPDAAGEVEAVFPGMWPRWVFDRIGLFDPEMVRNEDNEFSLRIRRAGGTIWLDPQITVAYEPRATLRSLFTQYRGYGFGKVRVAAKHRGGLRWRHLVPATWVGFLAVSLPVVALVTEFRLPALAVIGAYIIVIAVGAFAARARDTSPLMVAAAFATIHLGYGIGVWAGIIDYVGRVAKPGWPR